MNVTALTTNGNSSKFQVTTKRGDFVIALSFTLRVKVWQLADADEELAVATDLAQAIVSRHDPLMPFKKVYIFGDHNTETEHEKTIQRIRKHGFDSFEKQSA